MFLSNLTDGAGCSNPSRRGDACLPGRPCCATSTWRPAKPIRSSHLDPETRNSPDPTHELGLALPSLSWVVEWPGLNKTRPDSNLESQCCHGCTDSTVEAAIVPLAGATSRPQCSSTPVAACCTLPLSGQVL
jgi:hypothetical protein